MKTILLLITLIISTSATAQRESDQRTLPTKITDLLAEMPAEDEEQFRTSMTRIAAMGEEGLEKMTEMLVDQSQGNNTRLEYAIGGFSYYVTQPGRENLREISVKAYCQVLGEMNNEENKAFIIRQLGIVAEDAAVSCLQNYLDDERLCAPAVKALVNINTFNANEALLRALPKADGFCRLSIVQALGDTKFDQAVAAITPLANSENNKLKKLALYSLANIANPASEDILALAAKDDNFIFDKDNATSAYLLYAQRLLENGQKQQAEKIAKSLLKGTKKANQMYTRTAALKLLTDIHGVESVLILINATKSSDPGYRAAALKFASDFITPETTEDWVKRATRSNPEIEAEIIWMLGENNASTAIPAIVKALKSRSQEVRLSAIGALGKIGNEELLSDLFKVMRKNDEQELAAIKEALLIINANGLTNAVAEALPNMPANAQVALLYVLGNRAATERINDVFHYVEAEDTIVRMAALTILDQIATKENLPRLFSLLNTLSSPEEIKQVQDAIIVGVHDYDDQVQQTNLVLEQFEVVSAEEKPRYFPILASIGGEQALNAVSSEFNRTGYAATKAAAINALSAWSDAGAAKELFRISQDEANVDYKNVTLDGYVRAISQSEYPAAQKLLMLRKAFDMSGIQHKQLILDEVGKLKSFHAMVFAGEYLDEPLLQQEAARAVMNIAINNEYYGVVVRRLLNKTVEVLEGAESQYLKQSIQKFLEGMPPEKGFVPLFNGEDLSGWKGLVANPIERAKMDEKTLNQKQKKADEEMRESWKVQNGELIFTGEGNNITTEKKYGDFEMLVDWKIYDDGHQNGDAGIYLRGTPQVQIWDTSRVDVGAQVGSGGLYNNQINPSEPLVVADNPLGEWNHFHIIMKGDRVTVYLNGELVTDNVILENYWNREMPIFPEGQIELQAHGSRIGYRDIFIREIPKAEPFELSAAEKEEGFEILFDGTNMHNWIGNTTDYVIENGEMVVRKPKFGSGGNLFTKEEYSDFVFRFEFKLTPGANNGLGIRAPLEGDAAYEGMELQILDNDADIYKNLEEYQYHGSIYGVMAAKRGYLKPVGDWNYQEVIVNGPKIKVILNGITILDGDISEAIENGTLDGKDHPGLKRDKGHIGFLGHGSEVWIRNIRIRKK